MVEYSKPYVDFYVENKIVRIFFRDIKSTDLKWHKDLEDRYICCYHPTDWKIQLENELPTVITSSKFFIPKNTFHRLHKGMDDLRLVIEKIE